VLLPVILAGAWEESAVAGRDNADQALLARLGDVPYRELRERCGRWAVDSDTPVRRTANVWFVVSPADGWELLAPYADPALLGRFRETVLCALPQSAIHRGSASFVAGGTNGEGNCSTRLRVGLADTLALIAVRAADQPLTDWESGAQFADDIVHTLLHPSDGTSPWVSLSDVLPQLAEAAPDVFCAALDDGLDDGSVFTVLEPDPLTALASAELVGLLRALQRLAWSPEHLGSAVQALARLADEDQNRPRIRRRTGDGPGQALRQVLHPAGPQTGADFAGRIAALDLACRTAPQAGWDLMVGLLPCTYGVLEMSDTPRWRDWPSEPTAPTPLEQRATLDVLLRRMVRDAGGDGPRWAALIRAVPHLPAQEHRVVLGALASRFHEGGCPVGDRQSRKCL
jgi:hypothetical protein